MAHTFLIWGVKLLLELLSQQPSLYRSVCPFFLSHSLFLAFIPSQLPAFPLSHLYPSVFVCIASSILPSPISFSLSPIWPCFHDNLLFCLARNAFHKSVPMGNVTRMHSAQLQRGNHLMWPFTLRVWPEWEVSHTPHKIQFYSAVPRYSELPTAYIHLDLPAAYIHPVMELISNAVHKRLLDCNRFHFTLTLWCC